jgi:hypothetical protein
LKLWGLPERDRETDTEVASIHERLRLDRVSTYCLDSILRKPNVNPRKLPSRGSWVPRQRARGRPCGPPWLPSGLCVNHLGRLSCPDENAHMSPGGSFAVCIGSSVLASDGLELFRQRGRGGSSVHRRARDDAARPSVSVAAVDRRQYDIVATYVWNALPPDVRSCVSRLELFISTGDSSADKALGRSRWTRTRGRLPSRRGTRDAAPRSTRR